MGHSVKTFGKILHPGLPGIYEMFIEPKEKEAEAMNNQAKATIEAAREQAEQLRQQARATQIQTESMVNQQRISQQAKDAMNNQVVDQSHVYVNEANDKTTKRKRSAYRVPTKSFSVKTGKSGVNI